MCVELVSNIRLATLRIYNNIKPMNCLFSFFLFYQKGMGFSPAKKPAGGVTTCLLYTWQLANLASFVKNGRTVQLKKKL